MAPLYPFGEKMYTDSKMAAWRRSSFCNGASACVEVAPLADGNVALKDSKTEDGPVLVFTPAEWAAFTAGVRDGEFDLAALAASA
ncbi:hypothetical protein GCM10012289_31760 [Nonomuraea cavernae]|uniref:DUF397 domain-containing protein n=2 Tax=Nonomuraea cavernae TaxID=2045107 RepID=A0A918DJQ2_9ACTN|nr:hypothetical protein GCM10012289_31760 [Nonomuraea cavernae]